MFPIGAAGYGLLILRLSAAGMLMHSAMAQATLAVPAWELIAALLVASLLCLGALTPPMCIASGVIQIAMQISEEGSDLFQFGCSLCVTTALFLIGPGAFSIDSRLFGRRLILRSK